MSLYTHKLSEKETKKIIPFTVSTQNNKILRNKLNKVRDLHTENNQTPMKEIKAYTNKWKDTPYSCTGRLSIAKMPKTIKSDLQIQCIPYPHTNDSFYGHRENNPKIHMEPQMTTESKQNKTKQNKTKKLKKEVQSQSYYTL